MEYGSERVGQMICGRKLDSCCFTCRNNKLEVLTNNHAELLQRTRYGTVFAVMLAMCVYVKLAYRTGREVGKV